MTTNETLESKPQSNAVAMRSPSAIDATTVAEIVKRLAKRKTDNGQTFVTNKGKVSLFVAVCDEIRSLSGLEKTDENGNRTMIPAAQAELVKQAVKQLVADCFDKVKRDAEELNAQVTVRHNFLAVAFDKDDNLKVDLKSSIVTKKEQARNSGNFRMGVAMKIATLKKNIVRLETSAAQDTDGKNIDRLKESRRQLAVAENEYKKLTATTETK